MILFREEKSFRYDIFTFFIYCHYLVREKKMKRHIERNKKETKRKKERER